MKIFTTGPCYLFMQYLVVYHYNTANVRYLDVTFKQRRPSRDLNLGQPHLTSSELTFTLVGVCVRVALCLPSLASEQTKEVGAHLVLAPVLYCVALSTLLDEGLLSLGNVSHSQLDRQEGEKERKSEVQTKV